MSVHNGHPPYQPVCNERRLPDGQLRGACLNDDGTPMTAPTPAAPEPGTALAKAIESLIAEWEHPSRPQVAAWKRQGATRLRLLLAEHQWASDADADDPATEMLPHEVGAFAASPPTHDPAAPEPGTGTRDALAAVLMSALIDRAPGGQLWIHTEDLHPLRHHLAAALAPEVARIEAEAREAERERIAAKIEALLTTTGPKELARIVRSRP